MLCHTGRNSHNLTHKNVYARFVATSLAQITEGKQQPDNVRTQLHALEHFIMFLIHIEHFCSELQGFQQLRRTLPNWKAALGKMSKNVVSVRQARDFRERLTSETILQYEQSDRVKNITNILREAINIKTIYAPVETTFLDARNFMITKLTYDNGLRPGSLINFKFMHLEGVKPDSLGNVVFRVPEHKTASTYGTSEITIMADVYDLFKGYMKLRRHAAPIHCKPEDYIFITTPMYQAKPISSNSISNAMTNELRAVGYSYRANARKARKLIATKVTSNKPSEADAVANHMKHSVVTQRKYYVLHERDTEAVKATSAIRQALGVPTAPKIEGTINEVEVQESASAASSTITVQYNENSKKKASWSEDSKTKLMAAFKTYFDADEYVPKDKVRQFFNLAENALFRSVLETESEKSGEKLINAIYYLLRWFKNK